MAQTCVICKDVVDRDSVLEEFGEVFEQADYLGLDSLTEDDQAVVEGVVCSIHCYIQMD